MSDASKYMYGPEYFSLAWTFVGIGLILFAVGIVALIFFLTRKKQVRSLATLRVEAPKTVNMNELKTKYIGLIDQAERRFNDHQIKASVAHQHFSLIVRLFYSEAIGFHANIMTLDDLKRSRHTKLIQTIEDLYPDEFDTLEKGSVQKSAEEARKLVRDM